MYENIDPFDIVSGKVVQAYDDSVPKNVMTCIFKYAGNNLDEDGGIIYKNLHNVNGPAVMFSNGAKWCYIDGEFLFEKDFIDKIRCLQK